MVEKLESNGMKITYFSSAERVDFGQLAYYQPLLSDGSTPVTTSVQIAKPGCVAQMHSHPYTQVHFGIEGEVDVWTEGGGERKCKAALAGRQYCCFAS